MDVKALIHKHKPLLDIFVGTHAHDKSDGVWADLVTFPTPLTRLPPMDLQASVTPFCDQLGALARLYSLSAAQRAHTFQCLEAELYAAVMLEAHVHAALLSMAGRHICTVLMMRACSTDSIAFPCTYMH